MKALLALNESTTAEIIADLLQIPPEQAQAMAGQMRLSEILSLVQELKANNMWEASEIVKPYLAELTGPSGTGTAAVNQSKSTIKPTRPTVKGQNADQADMDAGKEQPDTYNKTITDQNGNMVAQVNGMDQADTLRGLRTSSKGTGKGQAIRQVTA